MGLKMGTSESLLMSLILSLWAHKENPRSDKNKNRHLQYMANVIVIR